MNKTTDDQARYVEDDVQDDAVIASAFRASLIVILLLGLPVIGVLVYLNIDKKQEVSTEVEVTTPDIREVNEEEIPVVARWGVQKGPKWVSKRLGMLKHLCVALVGDPSAKAHPNTCVQRRFSFHGP